DQVGEPADDFDQARVGRNAQNAGYQGGLYRTRCYQPSQIHGQLLPGDNPAGFMRGTQRSEDQACGDKNEERGGTAEKTRQIETHTTGINAPTEADGYDNTQQRTDGGQCGRLGYGKCGEQE